MGKIRYIGSKARIVEELMAIIGPRREGDGAFVDGFCGTGVVGSRAADMGWPIRLNDHLSSAVAVSAARLLSAADVPFRRLGGYRNAVGMLNDAEPVQGFFWREYSPAGAAGRRYFTEENAVRIDAARARLGTWGKDGKLSTAERRLLVADLIAAAGRVASIAGTYGCYLARWTGAALESFTVQQRDLRDASIEHTAYCGDVVDTPIAENDVAYFDPPYTKRQYAAYYHLNETLAHGDEPEVIGKTGLRPWQDRASEYCYKARALGALDILIRSTPAERIFLSYSSEGHVSLDDLCESLGAHFGLTLHEIGPVGRYRPNRSASAAGSKVLEYLIEIDKAPVAVGALA